MRIYFFFSYVWRPVHGDDGDSWLAAWWKYRMDIPTAWKVAGTISKMRAECIRRNKP